MSEKPKEQEKVKLWKGGLPYGPDTNRLDMAFPKLEPGDSVVYDSIGEIIKEPWPSPRFMGVLASWRKRLFRDRRLFTACDPGKALKILTAPEASKYHTGGLKDRSKQAIRHGGKLNYVPLEDMPDEQTKMELLTARRIADQLASAVRSATKELAAGWAAPKSLPKPRLVKPEKS